MALGVAGRVVFWSVVSCSVLSCRTETLGVEIPPSGIEAIRMDDLQRDTWLLTQTPRPGAPPNAEVRLSQMHLEPTFGGGFVHRLADGAEIFCGSRRSGDAAVTLFLSTGAPLSQAAIISLAKTWDPRVTPRQTLVFCLRSAGVSAEQVRGLIAAERLESVIEIGALGGETVTRESDGDTTRYASTDIAVTVDYRVVATQLAEIARRLHGEG